MNAGHTPGPWMAQTEAMLRDPEQRCRIVALRSTRHDVATTCIREISETEEANARLIAAAPELLEACANWIDWLDPDAPWREDAADHEARMLDAMRAAIAKARGTA